jgi:uncharacterized RDD family membrane protein YckC
MTGLPDPELQPEFYTLVPLKRLIAWVVDSVLILLLTLLVVLIGLLLPLFILPLVYGVIGIALRTVSIARWSATPGMILMAIEFRDAAGRPLDPATAFLHTLGFTLANFFVVPQIVSVAMMLLTARGQGLVDVVLGTTALNRPGAV